MRTRCLACLRWAPSRSPCARSSYTSGWRPQSGSNSCCAWQPWVRRRRHCRRPERHGRHQLFVSCAIAVPASLLCAESLILVTRFVVVRAAVLLALSDFVETTIMGVVCLIFTSIAAKLNTSQQLFARYGLQAGGAGRPSPADRPQHRSRVRRHLPHRVCCADRGRSTRGVWARQLPQPGLGCAVCHVHTIHRRRHCQWR